MSLIRRVRKSVERQVPEVTKPYLNRVYRPLMQTIFNFKYRNFDTLTVQDGDIKAEFDTSKEVAKNWFFPGMDDGSFHEPVVTRKLLDCLRSDSVFFDVGANMGYFSVLAAQVCSEVHSFEMDPTLSSIIKSNFERNKINGRIVNKAVSDQSGIDVSFSPHQSGNPSTNKLSIDNQTGVTVTTVSLDDYAEENEVSPDVVKIDVEGAEGNVLSGGKRVFANEVKYILLEVHPEHIETFGHNLEAVSDKLSKWGYSCSVFDSHRSEKGPDDILRKVAFKDMPKIEKNTMYFCSRNE